VPEVTRETHDFRHGLLAGAALYSTDMDSASTTAERGLRAAGLLAWAGAALPLVLAVIERGLSPRRALALVAFLVFGAAFVYATAPTRRRRSHLLAGIGLQFVAAASAAFIYPATATFVLTVIIAIQFPFVFPLRGALLAGLGLTLTPRFVVADALADGGLVPCLEPWTAEPASVYGVYPARQHLSAKLRAFLDFAAHAFRDD